MLNKSMLLGSSGDALARYRHTLTVGSLGKSTGYENGEGGDLQPRNDAYGAYIDSIAYYRMAGNKFEITYSNGAQPYTSIDLIMQDKTFTLTMDSGIYTATATNWSPWEVGETYTVYIVPKK